MTGIKQQKGLTLVELMISLAIVAILLTSVGPSVQSILIQNRIIAEINEVSAIMQFARATAIDQQTDVVLCPSSDFSSCGTDWNSAHIVFMDLNENGDRDADEDLLVAKSIVSPNNTLDGPNSSIIYQGNGAVSSPATLLVCHKNKDDKYARAIVLSLQGRLKMSADSNGDGIYENNSGVNLDCG